MTKEIAKKEETAITNMTADKAQEMAAKYGRAAVKTQVKAENLLPFYKCEYGGDDNKTPGLITNPQGVQFNEIIFAPALFFASQEFSTYDPATGYNVICYAPPTTAKDENGQPLLKPTVGTQIQEPEGGLCANCKVKNWKTVDGERKPPKCTRSLHMVGFHFVGLDPENPNISSDMIQPFQTVFRKTNVPAAQKMVNKLLMHYSPKNEFTFSVEDQEIKFDGMFRTLIKMRYKPKDRYFIPQFEFIELTINENFAYKLICATEKLETIFMERAAREVQGDDDGIDLVTEVD